jgi:apolipoprotein N-acyltransferase
MSLLCLLAGGLLPLAFAPFSLWCLAILSPLLLLWAWSYLSPKQAFVSGWIYGLAYFGIGVSWINTSIHDFGQVPISISLLISAIFISFLALFPALQGYMLRKFYGNYSANALLIGLPCTWVLLELLRSWIFTGFPWLLMGYSQLNSPLIHYAPLFSVYGVSFLLMLTVGLIYLILTKIKELKVKKFIYIFYLLLIWLSAYSLRNVEWTNIDPTAHSVSIIQSNLKPSYKSTLTLADNWQVYEPLTLQGLNSSLIIWPEHSVPEVLPLSQTFIDELDQFGKMHNTTFIVGVAAQIELNDSYFNTLLAVGDSKGVYHKQHLVPFGEYLPFADYLSSIVQKLGIQRSLFVADTEDQQDIIISGAPILPLICYEIAFVDLVREGLVATKAGLIVNISEDGWFGDSWGPAQHLDIARMRAIETGRYVVRSTTSGISAIIDQHGVVVEESPLFTAYVLTGNYYNASGLTPWAKLGLPFLGGLIFVIFILSLSRKKTA